MRYGDNLAYDFEYYGNTARVQTKVQEHKQQSKAKAKAKKADMYKTISICAIMLSLCAGFMISRNVAVYESRNEVITLQKELNELKEYSSQKAFELEQSIDLDEIEKWARTERNMTKPEKYQIVYVNIKQDDITEVKANDVEGFDLAGIFR